MRRSLLAVTAIASLGLATLTACNGDSSSPSCAKSENQNGMSANEQVDCLDQVSKWCEKNDPKELAGACEDKVFGYIPGKPGDGS